MKLNQEQISIFNDMISEAIIYGMNCQENFFGIADDDDLRSSVESFLKSLEVDNVVLSFEGYIGLKGERQHVKMA